MIGQKSTCTSSVFFWGGGIFVMPTASDFPQNHSVSRDLRLRSVIGQFTDVNKLADWLRTKSVLVL